MGYSFLRILLQTQATFVHFDSVLLGYIKAYGPYPFDKVGFVSVPLMVGRWNMLPVSI